MWGLWGRFDYMLWDCFCNFLLFNQGRSEEGQRDTMPRVPNHWGAPISLNNVASTFFNTVPLFPKILTYEHGGQGHQTSFMPRRQGRIKWTRDPGQSREHEAPKRSAQLRCVSHALVSICRSTCQKRQNWYDLAAYLQRQLGVTMYGGSHWVNLFKQKAVSQKNDLFAIMTIHSTKRSFLS